MTSYAGGKQAVGKDIARILHEIMKELDIHVFWDSFCGMCSVIKGLSGYHYERYASDLHEPVVRMWQQLQKGWKPPLKVSEREYENMKKSPQKYDKHILGFVGHGYSYAGLYFAGYKCKYSEYDKGCGGRAVRGVQKVLPHVKDVKFTTGDYKKVYDSNFIPKRSKIMIYCDPPYMKTAGMNVGGTKNFDNAKFWDWARKLSAKKNTCVVISEFSAPKDFKCIWSKKRDIKMANNTSDKNTIVCEKLFIHRDAACFHSGDKDSKIRKSPIARSPKRRAADSSDESSDDD